MDMNINWNRSELEKVDKKLKQLSTLQNVSLNELLTPTFMRKYTDFSSIDEFVEASQLNFENLERLEQSLLDSFVASHSSFNNWNDMLLQAVLNQFQNKC